MAKTAMTQQCLNVEEFPASAGRALENEYLIAGLPVKLCFESADLKQQVAPAFEHLLKSYSTATPALTVSVRRTGRLAPWTLGPTDILISQDQHSITIRGHEGHLVSRLETNGTGSWSTSDSESIPYLMRSAPMRQLLTLWMGRQRRYLVHSAAVGQDGKGVLIVAKGGSGKSTTSLSCVSAGMEYVGDDHCLVSTDEIPWVHSLYNTGKLTVSDFQRFKPLLEGAANLGRPPDEKLICYLNRVRGVKVAASLALKAILLPRIVNQKTTRLVPVSSAQGLRALTPSIALHLLSMRAEALRAFNLLARKLPLYDLQLGREFASAPEAIRDLLAAL